MQQCLTQTSAFNGTSCSVWPAWGLFFESLQGIRLSFSKADFCALHDSCILWPQASRMQFGALQGFWGRVQNYLQYLLMETLVMSDASSAERQLSNEFGYTADGRPTRQSTAAAMIATGDWALEYPFPLPPKVHVSFKCKWECLANDFKVVCSSCCF